MQIQLATREETCALYGELMVQGVEYKNSSGPHSIASHRRDIFPTLDHLLGTDIVDGLKMSQQT